MWPMHRSFQDASVRNWCYLTVYEVFTFVRQRLDLYKPESLPSFLLPFSGGCEHHITNGDNDLSMPIPHTNVIGHIYILMR